MALLPECLPYALKESALSRILFRVTQEHATLREGIGRRDHSRHDQPQRLDQNVAFAPCDFLVPSTTHILVLRRCLDTLALRTARGRETPYPDQHQCPTKTADHEGAVAKTQTTVLELLQQQAKQPASP
jgi:hypothetical protein